MVDLVLREMVLEDIDQVMQIDIASFATPWPRQIFYQELVENKFAHYYVIEDDKEILGYAGLWLVVDDAQVTNIAVNPNYRGNKFGEKLFRYAIQKAMGIGMKRLSLEVRVSNIIAQKLYRKFGLVPGGIRKNYYTDNGEDAIVMWVNLA